MLKYLVVVSSPVATGTTELWVDVGTKKQLHELIQQHRHDSIDLRWNR
jgi:hypothetical protein